jgi:hypothetical protein
VILYRPLFLLLILAPTSARAQDPLVPAFIEVRSAADEYFVDQTIVLQLRLGIEREFFDQQLIPLFRRQLDFPVQVDASFLLDYPVAQVSPEANRSQSLVLNGGLQFAEILPDRLIDGRAYRTVQMQYQFRADRAGEIKLAPAELRLAYATAFQQDLVQGRVPESRLLASVASEAFTLQIKALPLAAVPNGFVDAVGQFSMNLSADPGPLRIGQAFTVQLKLSSPPGASNLAELEPPEFTGLDGFHAMGQIELPTQDPSLIRTWRYELAVSEASIHTLPMQRFFYFDPRGQGSYRSLNSEPIGLQILVDPEPKESMAETPIERESTGLDFSSVLVFLALFPWLLVFGLWIGWRSRRRRPKQKALSHTPSDDHSEDGLVEFLARALQCSCAAIICPGLAQRLEQAGVSAQLAAEVAATIEGVTAARYGGPEFGSKPAELAAIKWALQQELPSV